MNFTTQTNLIQNTVTQIAKEADNYGVCSKTDWKIINITPTEIQIKIQTINMNISNNPGNKDYPLYIYLTDDGVNGYLELTIPEILEPFHSLKTGLNQALTWIYKNAL